MYPDLVAGHEVIIERVQQFGCSRVCADLHELNPEHIVPDTVTFKTMRRINNDTLEIRLVGYTCSCEPSARTNGYG